MSGPDISRSDAVYVIDALTSGWYGIDAYKYVELFEREFASFHSRKFGLMTTNCTHALHLLLAALGIGKGDSVVVPDITWIATAAPVKYVGAELIFADVSMEDWCLSKNTIEKVIKPNTKAVITVDVFGNMPNYDELSLFCEEKNLLLIEDAAEALGSITKNRRAGSFGVGSVFSFHRTKTLSTGEGGMLLTDDDDLYKRCKFLRDHGRSPGSFYSEEIAFKYMPNNLLASLGHSQFLRIEELIQKKVRILEHYKSKFADLDFANMNPTPEEGVNGAWCSVLNWDASLRISSEKFNNILASKGIPTRPFFYPLSSLPFSDELSNINFYRENNRNARLLHNNSICLPSALNLNEEKLNRVSLAVREVFNDLL